MEAGLLPLLMSVVHITGSLDVLQRLPPTKPPQFSCDTSGSIGRTEAASLRSIAADAIRHWRDIGCPPPRRLLDDELRRMTEALVGKPLDQRYGPLLTEELGLAGDARAFRWRRTVSSAEKSRWPVMIVGAGMAGLVMGYRLKQAGIPFTIVEKNSGPGGTWFENRYPGARVDVPSHCYSYSFIRNHRWPELFSPGPVLRAYFDTCVERLGLGPYIRYGVSAVRAIYYDAAAAWDVTLNSSAGEEQTRVRAFVSAVGQLNRPLIPKIEGETRFKGVRCHTSRWPEGLDLTGKRVAVIGTAATALQVIPEIAKVAKHLTVFQRSPTWCLVHPEYRRAFRSGEQWAMNHLPGYARWYRVLLYNWAGDGSPDHLRIDPKWPQDGRSVSAANQAWRERLTHGITKVVGHDPDILSKVLPDYPPGGKRPNLGDGGFYQALTRDNVELVTEAIDRFTESGLIDRAGVQREFDAIIYATGFRALEYLAPMEIVGREGVKINDFWQDDPGAYLGIAVPQFPNLFMMYGPGTNLGYNGNLFFNAECQAHYISGCLRWMIEEGIGAIEVTSSVYAEYEKRKSEALARFTWSLPGAGNWYKNRAGKVIANSPWPLVDYWEWTREPNPSDYAIRSIGSTVSDLPAV
jgi:4-hydroxyacetophenone monooxygenase